MQNMTRVRVNNKQKAKNTLMYSIRVFASHPVHVVVSFCMAIRFSCQLFSAKLMDDLSRKSKHAQQRC